MSNDSMKENIDQLKSDFERSGSGFSMEYLSISGRRFGLIPEWESRLTVIGAGAASLFRRRGPGDSNQRAPGKYTGQISRDSLFAFLDALADSGIQDSKSGIPGPRDPIDFLRVLIKDRLYGFSWGFSAAPEPPPMEKLTSLLFDWTQQACAAALWSLNMTVESLEINRGALSARLKMENLGRQSILVANPASPGFGSHFGLLLKYGEAQFIQEGYTPAPMEIKKVPLEVSSLPTPEFLEIRPEYPHFLDFTASLEGEAPRGWIGKFAFFHYLTEDTVAGRPVFNGALFTEERKW